jgi:hypothetical protein
MRTTHECMISFKLHLDPPSSMHILIRRGQSWPEATKIPDLPPICTGHRNPGGQSIRREVGRLRRDDVTVAKSNKPRNGDGVPTVRGRCAMHVVYVIPMTCNINSRLCKSHETQGAGTGSSKSRCCKFAAAAAAATTTTTITVPTAAARKPAVTVYSERSFRITILQCQELKGQKPGPGDIKHGKIKGFFIFCYICGCSG